MAKKDNEFEQNQILAIKQRLNRILKKNGYNENQHNKLKKLLNEEYGYNIYYPTLVDTLSESKLHSLNMICVIAICRYFNIDIAYVLSEPDNPNSEIYETENQFISEKFSILNDSKYFGKYYGYFYSPKESEHRLDEFVLEIKSENEKTVARLSVNYHSKDHSGKSCLINKILIGTPIFVNPSNIYIVFTEPNGLFIILSFSFVLYSQNNLYFRRGAMITRGQMAGRPPLLQAFVMFREKMSQENIEKYLPGFLLLNDSVFHLPANNLKELCETYPEVDNLFKNKNFNYIFTGNRESYYRVDESQILISAHKSDLSETDIVKALQLMKLHATDAKRIYFKEHDEFYEFSKDLN